MALTEVSWRNTLSKPQTKDITPSLSVRRCLFGPVDHEIVRQDLQKEMKAMSESSAREWNFDFEKTCPLPGRYLWSRVETNSEKCNRRDTSVCRPQISSGNGLTKTTTKDFGCVNTSSKNASKLDRKTPQSHKITEFLRHQKPSTRSGKYTKRLRAQTRERQTCLDKFLK